MRWLLLTLLMWPLCAQAQSRTVAPEDLSLTVEVIEGPATPYTREMVMIVIRGTYRRHVTREQLEQPDLDGFNWTQLGPDIWREERIRGRPVKVMERRMALYAERPGRLTIGAFTHHLTLTDEDDNWFAHDITSAPVTVEIAAPPVSDAEGWWFPAKRLEISDQWSNAPDRLTPGQGVLRIVRVEALGVTPEMIPPMPDLTSPSGMVFPHPEKRLVELTPYGPVSYAFWRWTIQPTNGRSAIVEPLEFSFYDTENRVMREVTISAQRVAYAESGLPPPDAPVPTARLPGWPLALLAGLVFAGGLLWVLKGRQADAVTLRRRLPWLDPQARRMLLAVRRGDTAATRRAARGLLRGSGQAGAALLHRFDADRLRPGAEPPDLRAFARSVLGLLRRQGYRPNAALSDPRPRLTLGQGPRFTRAR